MENSDLTAIVKELMALFAPKKEENFNLASERTPAPQEKAEPMERDFSAKKEEAAPRATPFTPARAQADTFAPLPQANPFIPLKPPEVRYQEFLLRHEAQKRKTDSAKKTSGLEIGNKPKKTSGTKIGGEPKKTSGAKIEGNVNPKSTKTASTHQGAGGAKKATLPPPMTKNAVAPPKAKTPPQSEYFSLPLFPKESFPTPNNFPAKP